MRFPGFACDGTAGVAAPAPPAMDNATVAASASRAGRHPVSTGGGNQFTAVACFGPDALLTGDGFRRAGAFVPDGFC
jgi:hypothetical protein